MSAPGAPGPSGANQLELKTPLHTMAAFGIGNIPDSIKNWSWNAFVLFLYAQVHGLSGSLTGIAILIALIVDAVSDPYVGFLSDRAQGWKYGRRHTLMMFAVVPFGFCF
ncbi:MAG: MFS transporter, partial [Gammaproteobacteria bacterium]|nr:MFS transporter [Gammaproteobacteria bacterium]